MKNLMLYTFLAGAMVMATIINAATGKWVPFALSLFALIIDCMFAYYNYRKVLEFLDLVMDAAKKMEQEEKE